MSHSRIIRSAAQFDDDAIWRVIEPVFRAGETYPLPRDISRADAFAYWRASGNEVFVAEDGGRIVGTYYLRANNRGGGSHVANCGYIVAANASRRGVARAMCAHSLERARGRGFTAMQDCGFAIVGTLPGAFAHPIRGLIDAYVMYRSL
jgi:predicted N-acetyltransferase YhbS